MENDGAICGYQPEIMKGYLISDGSDAMVTQFIPERLMD